MDLGTMLYNNLKDVPWSNTSLPLDQLVSAYRLPQIVKLDNGKHPVSQVGLLETQLLQRVSVLRLTQELTSTEGSGHEELAMNTVLVMVHMRVVMWIKGPSRWPTMSNVAAASCASCNIFCSRNLLSSSNLVVANPFLRNPVSSPGLQYNSFLSCTSTKI